MSKTGFRWILLCLFIFATESWNWQNLTKRGRELLEWWILKIWTINLKNCRSEKLLRKLNMFPNSSTAQWTCCTPTARAASGRCWRTLSLAASTPTSELSSLAPTTSARWRTSWPGSAGSGQSSAGPMSWCGARPGAMNAGTGRRCNECYFERIISICVLLSAKLTCKS